MNYDQWKLSSPPYLDEEPEGCGGCGYTDDVTSLEYGPDVNDNKKFCKQCIETQLEEKDEAQETIRIRRCSSESSSRNRKLQH